MHAYVIGNAVIDETFAVSSLPKAGESIFGSLIASNVGGKGCNQAIVLARCGVPATLIAAVGNDGRAALVRALIEGEGLASRLIIQPNCTTDMSVILRLANGENAIITTTEAARSLSFVDVQPFLAGAFRGDLVVLQGNLNGETTLSIMKYAKQLGMIVAFNPSPLQAYFADLWPLVDIAFVNEGEASSLTGLQGEAASAALLALGVDLVVQTNGAEGALLTARNVSSRVSASKCEVVDTTGAGDTFMAVALASSMLRRAKLDPTAVESASLAASLTVSRLGTLSAFPTREELATILAQT